VAARSPAAGKHQANPDHRGKMPRKSLSHDHRLPRSVGSSQPLGHALGQIIPGGGEHDNATTGQDPRMRYVKLRRHTDSEGDRQTPQGATDAEEIGRDRVHPPYAALVSCDAARATQMLEILRHAAGQSPRRAGVAWCVGKGGRDAG
jgi:hypothetical protein